MIFWYGWTLFGALMLCMKGLENERRARRLGDDREVLVEDVDRLEREVELHENKERRRQELEEVARVKARQEPSPTTE